jgi:hypothetical protein
MSTDVVATRRPLAPLDVLETKAAMEVYQSGMHAVLDPVTDWQTFTDRKGEKHSFLKRSGWRKIATWFGLDLEVRSSETDRDVNGDPLRTRVICRAIAANGRFADGEGACDLHERSVTKPEHDLLAIAGTRAMNRAISNLVGLGAVSAEELSEGDASAVALPFGPIADDALVRDAAVALEKAVPGIDSIEFIGLLQRQFGTEGLPEVAARTLNGLQWWRENRMNGTEQPDNERVAWPDQTPQREQ